MSESQPPVPGSDNHTALQAFIAHQTAGFYGWIYSVVVKFNEGGVLPPEVFSETGKLRSEEKGRRKKSGQVKKPRPMNAFNYFVQQKMSEFKEKGIKAPHDGDNKTLFAMAVNEWKELDAAARDQFTADFKLTHPPAAVVSPDEAHDEAHDEEMADEVMEDANEELLEEAHEEEEEGQEEEDDEEAEVEGEEGVKDASPLTITPLDLPASTPAKKHPNIKKEKKEKKKSTEKPEVKVKEESKMEPERQSKRDRKPKVIEDLGAEPDKKKKKHRG